MLNFRLSDFMKVEGTYFGDAILVNRRQYKIPFNQRPFRWGKQHLDELWDDFIRTMRTGYVDETGSVRWKERSALEGYPHFFGTFMFVLDQPDEMEVFDGQQRLTAVSMLAATLRDICVAQLSKETSSALESVRTQLNRWLTADPIGIENRPRVLADPEYRELFEKLIVEPTSVDARKRGVDALGIAWKESPNHKRLFDGFAHLHQKVIDTVAGYSDVEIEKFLVAAVQTMAKYFTCVATEIPNEAFAFQVFKSLNGRGEPLSQTDNVKNELFLRSQVVDHQEIANRWREAVASLGPRDFGVFLRRRYLGLYGGRCRENELFTRISDRELRVPRSEVLTVVSKWRSDADLARRVRQYAGFNQHTSYILRSIFETLGASLAEIVLLPAARSMLPTDASEFERVSGAVLAFCFRELTIGAKKTNWLEQKLSEVGCLVSSGACADRAITELRAQSDDEVFKQRFATATERRPRVQYYIFFEIERHLARSQGLGLEPFPASVNQHIEHILPKRLPSDVSRWGYWRNKHKKHDAYLDRLGNLMVLEGAINVKIKNRSFEEKQTGIWVYAGNRKVRKTGYVDSTLRQPQELTDRAKWASWHEDDIEKRQRALAELAVKVWQIT